MGTKGKKKRHEPPQPPKNQGGGEVGTGPVSATWSDCSNSCLEAESVLQHKSSLIRLEAESVLQHKDGVLQDKSTSPPQHKDGLLQQKQTKAAASSKRLAEALVRKNQRSPLAHHLAGHVYMASGEADLALPRLLRASELRPNCLEIAYSIATVHATMKHHGLAADECKRALAIQDPTDPALLRVDVELPPTVSELSANATLRIATAKERLRVLFAEASAFPRDMDAIRCLWSTMTKENQSDFLKVNLDELRASFKSQSGAITDASDFFKGTQKWDYWLCPQCKSVYLDPQPLMEHVQETHIHGLQQILLQKGQFCEPIEVDTRQLSGRVRLDQDKFHLSFDNDETVPDSVTFEGEFFKWLTTPAPEVKVSHFSIIQNSISQGIEILQNLESMKRALMLKES